MIKMRDHIEKANIEWKQALQQKPPRYFTFLHKPVCIANQQLPSN